MAYTQTQFEDTMRKTQEPWEISLYTTAAESLSFTGAQENKLLLTNIAPLNAGNGFQSVVTDDGIATQFVGDGLGNTYTFDLSINMSVEASLGAVETTFSVYVRDADQTFVEGTQATGWTMTRTFTNNSIGVMGKGFPITLTEGQLIDFSVNPTGDETLNFVELSADLKER